MSIYLSYKIPIFIQLNLSEKYNLDDILLYIIYYDSIKSFVKNM